MGDGTGRLCLANGTGVNISTLTCDGPGTRYLVPGMYITIGTSAAVQISAISSSTVVTLASTVATWADNSVVYKENTADMMGLKGLIDTGAYVASIQNIARSSNTWAQSQTYTGTLTEAQMINLYLRCMEYGKPNVIFAGPYGFAAYGALLTSMKRTSTLTEVLSGGWKGLEFMGGDCGVMLDYDCPEPSSVNQFMFFTDFDSLSIAEMTEPFKWLESEANGGILHRSASNRTVWEGTMKYYANLVAKSFQGNGVYQIT
jgi:hypothetical protein